jgi:hypothetical protein
VQLPPIFLALFAWLISHNQQYFSFRTNQAPATSQNQPAVLFSQNKPAPAISHQPTEQAEITATLSIPNYLPFYSFCRYNHFVMYLA